MSAIQDADRQFRRVLGPLSATCIVVGAIIGVGIFFTPTDVARLVGSRDLALLTWMIGGCIAVSGALTFAELGGMYPKTGGQFDILRDSYGGAAAFLYVFCNATAIQAGAIAVIAVIAMDNLGVLFHGEPPSPLVLIVGSIAMVGGLICANAIGVRWGSTIQNITVFVKVGTLLLVTLLAAIWGTGSDSTPPVAVPGRSQPALALVFAGLVPVLFSFGGWQHALWIGGEVRDSAKNVPRAIVIGVAIVTLVYLLANWAYFQLLGFQGVAGSKALAADAVSRVWPQIGQRLVASAVAFSAFGVLNAQLLSGPRLVCGMAREGQFFKLFAQVNPRWGTPLPAITLLGGMGLVWLGLHAILLSRGQQGVGQILTGVVLVDAIFFFLTGVALIVLRRRRPDAVRPVRVPWYPLMPLVFAVGEAAIIVGAFLDKTNRNGAWIGAVWILAGGVVYFWLFRTRQGRV